MCLAGSSEQEHDSCSGLACMGWELMLQYPHPYVEGLLALGQLHQQHVTSCSDTSALQTCAAALLVAMLMQVWWYWAASFASSFHVACLLDSDEQRMQSTA